MEPSKRGFCHLKWDHHLQNIGNLFNSLFCTNTLIDVTIACQEGSLEAHKFVLSACSPYFSRILSKNPCQHPVLIMHGICLADMKLLVEFMYKGAVDVPEYKVMELVQTAIKLEIKGFYYSAQKSNNHNMTIGKNESAVGDKNKASKKKSLIKNKTIVDVKKRKLSEDIDGDDEQENDVAKNEVEVKNEEGSLELNPVRRRTRFRGLKRVPVSEVVVQDSSDSDSQTRNSYSKKQSAIHKTHDDGLSSITISDVIGANGDITLTARENTNLTVQNFRDHSESPIDNSPDVESLIPDITISEPFNGDAEKENEEDPIDIKEELLDVEIKHEDIIEPPPPVKKTDSKPFRCEFCNLGFARSSHLLRHRRTHTGERPFQCSKCEKRFARQDKLKIHMRSHEDDFYPTIRKFKMPETTVSNEILTSATDEPKKPTATQSIIDSVNAISKPVVIESHNLLKRRRGRPRTRIIPRIEFKRSRGRPRKTQSLDSSSLNMPHDNNYDITSLPFGDLNYLTSELPIDLNSAGPSYHHPLQVQYGVPVQMSAPGVQLSTTGVQLSTTGVQLSTTGVQLSTNGIQLSTPGVQLSPPGVQLSTPGIQMSTSGVQMSTSGVQMSTAGASVPVSAVQIQAGVPVPIQTAVQIPTGVPVQIQANPFGQMIASTPQSEVTSVTTTTEQAVTTPTQTTASTPEVSSSSSSTPSGTPNRATALLDSIRLIGECTISPVN